MNQFVYAQLDEENICVSVSQLSGEVIQDDMIELNSYDASLLGKRYNNGAWEEVAREPIEPQPTNAEKIITMLQAQEQAALDRDETDLDQTLMLLDIQLNQSLQGGTNTMSKTEQIFGGGGAFRELISENVHPSLQCSLAFERRCAA